EQWRKVVVDTWMGRHRYHPGNDDLVLRVGARQDGQESERLDASFYGSWYGALRRRPWRQYLRLHRHFGEMGRKGYRSRSNDGNRSSRFFTSALPLSSICRIQGDRRLKRCGKLGLYSACFAG